MGVPTEPTRTSGSTSPNSADGGSEPPAWSDASVAARRFPFEARASVEPERAGEIRSRAEAALRERGFEIADVRATPTDPGSISKGPTDEPFRPLIGERDLTPVDQLTRRQRARARAVLEGGLIVALFAVLLALTVAGLGLLLLAPAIVLFGLGIRRYRIRGVFESDLVCLTFGRSAGPPGNVGDAAGPVRWEVRVAAGHVVSRSSGEANRPRRDLEEIGRGNARLAGVPDEILRPLTGDSRAPVPSVDRTGTAP
jgi:hypothetical protein